MLQAPPHRPLSHRRETHRQWGSTKARCHRLRGIIPSGELLRWFRFSAFDQTPLPLPPVANFSVSSSLTTQPVPAADLADLKRKSMRGGIITFASQGASVAIQLASTVILARLLSPADYGVMAMVVAITSFAGLFRDLGLSSAAIQTQTLTHTQQTNLFWINVILGSTLTVTLAAASPLVAWFYHKSEVLWVTVALSVTFVIGSLSTQSSALLIREMRFGWRSLATVSGAVVNFTVATLLALKGFGYWSLVWGQLAGAFISTCLLIALSPFRPSLPRRGAGTREMLIFGVNVTAFDFVNYFNRNLDNILIGRFWGPGALGLYSRAYALLMFPINNLRGPINAVAFPALSRLQNHPDHFRAYYRRITSLLTFVSMPLTAFLFVECESIIQLALGKNWVGVAPIFSWLALVGFIQAPLTQVGLVTMSVGKSRRFLEVGAFNATVVSAGFFIGVHWGPTGVAVAYAAATYVLLIPSLAWSFSGTAVSVGDFFKAIRLPCGASLVAATLVVLLRSRIMADAPYQFALLAAPYFASYFMTYALLPGGKDELRQLLALIQPMVGANCQKS